MKSTRACDTAPERRKKILTILSQKRSPKHFRPESRRCGQEGINAGPLHGEWRGRNACVGVVGIGCAK